MTNYSDKLPRKVRTSAKCQALNSDGTRCRNKACYEVDVSLDGEIYDYDGVHWITALICESHFNATWVFVSNYDKKKYHPH